MCYACPTCINMANKTKTIAGELVWIAFSAAITAILSTFLFGWTFVSKGADLHIHDTYFVVSRWFILIPLFLLINFIICFIKEKRKSFARTVPNLVLVVSGLICLVSLTYLIKFFSLTATVWALYPPMSRLNDAGGQQVPAFLSEKYISNFLIILQVVLLILLLYATYRWGTQKSKELIDSK